MGSQKKKAIKFIKKGNLKHKIAKRNEKKRFNAKKDKKVVERKSTTKNESLKSNGNDNDDGDILDEMNVDDFLNGDFLDQENDIENEQDSDIDMNDEENDSENDDDDDASSEEEDESALDPRYMSAMPEDDMDPSDEEGDVPQDGNITSRRELTMEKLKSIEKKCNETKSIQSLRPLLQIFSDACRSVDSGTKAKKNTPYDIRSSSVYNHLMVTVFKHTEIIWSTYLLDNSNLLDNKKWTKISMMIRRFFHCCVFLIQETTSEEIHRFILRGLNSYLRYASPCTKIARKLLKCFVGIWGKSLDPTVSMLSFVRIRELATLVPFPFLETCLKSLYLAYMRNVKFTNGINFQHHIVMGNCMVELYGIDLTSSYQHVFIYIRQLAMTIRKAIATPSADTLKGILTWRFINCLKVWGAVVSSYPALKALVYPLTQLILATIRLASITRYIPLKFQCIKILQQISIGTNTFIPTTPILLDILHSNYIQKKKKNIIKETDLIEIDLIVKLSKSALESRRIQEIIISKIFELLQKECDIQKFSIAFPEFGVPLYLSLSKFSSMTSVPQWKRLAKGLSQQIENRSEWIRNKRMICDIAPKDMEKIETFLAQERKTAILNILEKEKKQIEEKMIQYSKIKPKEINEIEQEDDEMDDDEKDDDENDEKIYIGNENDDDLVEDIVFSDE